MKTQKIEKTISLIDNIMAAYVIEKKGQCNVYSSDNVNTLVTLSLPAYKEIGMVSPSLLKDLQFEGRLQVMGEDLRWDWGNPDFENKRVKSMIFEDSKYSEGFKRAEEYITTEINKLSEALANRVNALTKADDI